MQSLPGSLHHWRVSYSLPEIPFSHPPLCIYSSLPRWVDGLSCDYLATPEGDGVGGAEVQTERNEKATEMEAQKYLLSMSPLLKLMKMIVKTKILKWLHLLQILASNYHLVIILTFCSEYRMNTGSAQFVCYLKKKKKQWASSSKTHWFIII